MNSFLSFVEYDTAFSHVNNLEVAAAYKSTSRRVIILDFNGTIVIKEPPGKYLKREILGTSGLKPPSTVSHECRQLFFVQTLCFLLDYRSTP